MRQRISRVLVGAVLVATTIGITALPAYAKSRTISGTVSCSGGLPVKGVWIKSSAGGNGYASWRATSSTSASYKKTVSTSAATTQISLHVGCGGTTKKWGSDNWSPFSSAIGGSATVNVTSCGSYSHTCTWTRAHAAAKWAEAHLSGTGSVHALSTDKITDTRALKTWAYLCLTFVASAYLNAGVTVSPGKWGGNYTATDWYNLYHSKHLIQKTSSTSAGNTVNPPRGAFVFYPTGGDGHIAISIGAGYVISAQPFKVSGAYVQKVKYNSSSLGPYKGWAFPDNASH